MNEIKDVVRSVNPKVTLIDIAGERLLADVIEPLER